MITGEYPVTKIIRDLERDNLLPVILFRTSRRQCDADITKLSQAKYGAVSQERQIEIENAVNSVIEKYKMPTPVITRHPHYQSLLLTACGAHHAGQLLFWRLLLEELMGRGLLRMLIATGTVAAGVDFPARTVVIGAHSKRGASGFSVLSSAEFQQMSGRAGRRGKDTVGFCLVAPGPYSDARVISDLTKKETEPLRSAYFAAPSTVLNLLKFRNVDDLRYTVSKSLAAFLDRKRAMEIKRHALGLESEAQDKQFGTENAKKKFAKGIRRQLREADELEKLQESLLSNTLTGLEKLGHLKDGKLTEKGYWAADLWTTLILELAEAIESEMFDGISLVEFVGLVASISGDSHRTYYGLRRNPIDKEYFERMQEMVDKVRAALINPQSAEVAVVPDAALTVITWMDSPDWQSFSGLLRLARVADGDAARLVTQTADHLSQIARLNKSHPYLAIMAQEGRKKILKPPLTEGVIEYEDIEVPVLEPVNE